MPLHPLFAYSSRKFIYVIRETPSSVGWLHRARRVMTSLVTSIIVLSLSNGCGRRCLQACDCGPQNAVLVWAAACWRQEGVVCDNKSDGWRQCSGLSHWTSPRSGESSRFVTRYNVLTFCIFIINFTIRYKERIPVSNRFGLSHSVKRMSIIRAFDKELTPQYLFFFECRTVSNRKWLSTVVKALTVRSLRYPNVRPSVRRHSPGDRTVRPRLLETCFFLLNFVRNHLRFQHSADRMRTVHREITYWPLRFPRGDHNFDPL